MTYRLHWDAYVGALSASERSFESIQSQVEIFECKGFALISSFASSFARLLFETQDKPARPPYEADWEEDDRICGPWRALLERIRSMDPMSSQISVQSTASSPSHPQFPVVEFPTISCAPPALLKSDVEYASKFSNTGWQDGILVLTLANEILCFTSDKDIEPKAAAQLGNALVRIDLTNHTLTVEQHSDASTWSKNFLAVLSSITSLLPSEQFVARIKSADEFEQWRDIINDVQSQARGSGNASFGRVTYSDGPFADDEFENDPRVQPRTPVGAYSMMPKSLTHVPSDESDESLLEEVDLYGSTTSRR